jgi:hypothetical protein
MSTEAVKTDTHNTVSLRLFSLSLRLLTILMLLLLAVQFLLGMVVNLFVQVPSIHPGVGASNYFQGVVQGVAWALVHAPLGLLVHAIVGLLLFLTSLILIGFAIASRRRAWIIVSVIGLIGIMAAGFNGASFMNYGGHNFSSLLMSIGFLLAAVAYTIGLSRAR